MAMDLAAEPPFRLGGLSIRPSTREIVHPGGRETIEPRVMEVLLVLARAKGEVVSRDRLVEACWEGRAVSEDAINRVISRIRKIADLTGGHDFTLETIPKTGYRLIPTEQTTSAAQSVPFPAEPAASPSAQKTRGRWVASVIAAAVAVFAAVGIGWAISWRPPPEDAPLTLAVLPFDDLSPAKTDEALATGMSREIRNTLSRVRGLLVVSDASSFAVAAENIPAPDTARRLNADLLLDGSFTREGDKVKLTAELVDGWKGVNIWTGSQTGPAADLDRLRQLMSASIFEQLVARLGPKRIVATSPPRHGDPRVYRLLLEANELAQQAKDLRPYPSHHLEMHALGERMSALIDRALEIDPGDPSALSIKGRMMTSGLVREDRDNPPLSSAQRRDSSADYLRRALATDPDNIQALTGLGDHYRRNEWRWADARALLERALALDPNASDTHLVYTYYLTTTGRCVEAAEHARSVVAIDPEFGWSTLGLPRSLKCAGEDAEANRLYLRQLTANPDEAFLVREIYLNYLERRDVAALRALRAEVVKANPGKPLAPPVEAMMVRAKLAADALEGATPPFLQRIEEDVAEDIRLDAQGLPNDQGRYAPDMMWMHAIEFAMAGSPQRAIDMLEQAVTSGSLYIPETLPYGAYEFTPEVRNDQRYQAIWRNDARLRELLKMRLASLNAGQMQGVLPDGREVRPIRPKTAPPKADQPKTGLTASAVDP
jgi:TolB-like protein/DNA-binding winged helix-turn-helix (wHTH) protein